MQIAMHIAKRCPPSVLAIRTAEAHGAVWVMIATLLGLDLLYSCRPVGQGRGVALPSSALILRSACASP